MSQNQSPTKGLMIVITVLVILLIGWNIYTGATVQELGIPGIFTIKFGPKPTSPSPVSVRPTGDLSDKYLMDNDSGRVIIVTYLGDSKYRIEEPSSPWPWEGTAVLDGGNLSGDANFRNSLARMRIEGIRRGDGTIIIQYKFITDDNGNPANGRIDNHIWYPTH